MTRTIPRSGGLVAPADQSQDRNQAHGLDLGQDREVDQCPKVDLALLNQAHDLDQEVLRPPSPDARSRALAPVPARAQPSLQGQNLAPGRSRGQSQRPDRSRGQDLDRPLAQGLEVGHGRHRQLLNRGRARRLRIRRSASILLDSRRQCRFYYCYYDCKML